MLKPGDIAIMKTTEEMVFILKVDVQAGEPYPGLTNVEVVVRRPIQTAERGVQYVTERFLADELETSGQKAKRNAEEYADFKRISKETAEKLSGKTILDDSTELLPN